jgi:hypothetical protein
MADIKRYVFSTDVPEKEAIAGAFKLCGEILKKMKEPAEVVIFIPQNGSFSDNLQEVLGEKMSKQLLKDGSISTQDGGGLRLETHRTFTDWKKPGSIIIGVYVTEEMLDQVDRVKNASAVIIVPWHMNDLKVWMKTWNPELNGKERAQPGALINNPIVEQALNSIAIAPPTGILHPSDRKTAIERFRKLKKDGIAFDSDDIKAWALRHHWDPSAANELRTIAADILKGKRIR